MQKSYKNENKIDCFVFTYNSSKFIEATIKSLLNQENVELNLKIFDDSSNDNTLEILENMNKNKIFDVIKSKKNRGIVKQMASSLKYIESNYVVIHSGDDISHPKRFFHQLNVLINNPNVVFHLCDLIVFNEDTIPKMHQLKNLKGKISFFSLQDVLDCKTIINGTAMYRAKNLKKIKLFKNLISDDPQLGYLTLENNIASKDEFPGYYYRLNSSGYSSRIMEKLLSEHFQLLDYFQSKGYITRNSNLLLYESFLNYYANSKKTLYFQYLFKHFQKFKKIAILKTFIIFLIPYGIINKLRNFKYSLNI
tara:strand:- start:2003 stop:2926 length:924 start_codon:yes stop_codon:yes gene_type:complete